MEWITILFVLSVLWLETECSGKIWLRLVYFNNAGGKGSNGHYCDGKFFVRGSDCDHRFIICFDTVDGPQNTNVCAYGRLRSVTVYNTNYITFGSTFGQVSNPMTFDFNRWGGSCKLKVDVYDDDDNSDDYVDFLHYNYYKSTPYYNESVAVKTDVALRNRVLFNVEMKVYCDPDYYGNGCDIYCKVTAKFTCNKQTGAKICSEDWTGTDCNVRKDACLSAPCKNQATCHNSMGSYLCVCPDGYTGTQCDQDVDECLSSPCKNNGTCTDLINNYKCTCPKGFRGQDCSDLIDLCLSNPCLNNGSCHMDPNDVKFHCDCPDGYDGLICDTDIDECAIDICKNGATCENSIGSFKCHCTDGWEGVLCDVDIDECSSSPCLNGAFCHDELNGFTCECSKGYTGNLCREEIDECSGNPCMHNGSCFDLVGSFICYCKNGWTGNICETDVDECHSSPCGNHGECINTNGSFFCQCLSGWTGPFCRDDVDECKTIGCLNGGTCSNHDGDFKCICKEGFTGEICNEDIDECLKLPCENNSTCTNNFGSYKCTCTHGFTGNHCSHDVNECDPSPCDNNSTCIDDIGHFLCKCPPDYEGPTCSDRLDPCKKVNCSENGVCISSGISYSCQCKIGFTGDLCQDSDKALQLMEENHSSGPCVEEDGGKIMMILDGVVTTDHEEKLISSITEAIVKYGVYNIKSINITNLDIRHLCLEEDRSIKCSSNVTFSIAINGTMLCGEKVKEIESLIRDNDMFKQSSSGIGKQISRAMTENQHIPKKTWFANNWYVVAIVIVLVVGAVGVSLFVLVRHKRRKLLYLEGAGFTSNSISWHSGTGASNTLPSLAFDNDLYTSGLQEQQTGNIPIQENPDLAFENDMYQQVIPEDQTKLMKCDVDRFDDDFH